MFDHPVAHYSSIFRQYKFGLFKRVCYFLHMKNGQFSVLCTIEIAENIIVPFSLKIVYLHAI